MVLFITIFRTRSRTVIGFSCMVFTLLLPDFVVVVVFVPFLKLALLRFCPMNLKGEGKGSRIGEMDVMFEPLYNAEKKTLRLSVRKPVKSIPIDRQTGVTAREQAVQDYL